MGDVIGGENVRDLGEGIFEDLLTGRLAKHLEGLRDLVDSVDDVPKSEAPAALARFLGPAIEAKLSTLDPEQMVGLSNRILELLDHSDEVLPGPRNLLSLTRDGDIRRRSFKRPQTPLSEAALLTNGRDEPQLRSELLAELSSADSVDLLCAFIKWEGLRLLTESLEELKAHNIPIRVITTTYMGATQRHAIDELVAGMVPRSASTTRPTRRASTPRPEIGRAHV